jgi:hypothetical protein
MRDLAVEVENTAFCRNGAGVLSQNESLQSRDIPRQCRGIERQYGLIYCFASARDLWPLGFAWSAPIDAFEHVAELRGSD